MKMKKSIAISMALSLAVMCVPFSGISPELSGCTLDANAVGYSIPDTASAKNASETIYVTPVQRRDIEDKPFEVSFADGVLDIKGVGVLVSVPFAGYTLDGEYVRIAEENDVKKIKLNTGKVYGTVFSGYKNLEEIESSAAFEFYEDTSDEGYVDEKGNPITYFKKAEKQIIPACFCSGCDNLKTFDYPDGLEGVGQGAFTGCSSLESIDLPDTVEIIEDDAYSYNKAFTTFDCPVNLSVIGDSAFSYCEKLNKVFLSNNLQTIKDYAFAHTPIKEIVIPDNVKNIGECAFASCDKLEKITLEGDFTVTDYDYFDKTVVPSEVSIFNSCSNVKEVVVKYGVTTIPANTFLNMLLLEKVSLPSTLKDIRKGAFKNIGAAKIELPDSIEKIGEEAFSYAYLESVEVPEKVTQLSKKVFAYTEKLNSIKLPEKLILIDDSAFNSSGIKKIDIPDTVEKIGSEVFKDSKLESIELPDKITVIPTSAFERTNSLVSVKLPAKLKEIQKNAFNCSMIDKIELPETLETIGENAFALTHLKEINVPKNVTSIGASAFDFGTDDREKAAVVTINNDNWKYDMSTPICGYRNAVIRGTKGSAAEEYVANFNANAMKDYNQRYKKNYKYTFEEIGSTSSTATTTKSTTTTVKTTATTTKASATTTKASATTTKASATTTKASATTTKASATTTKASATTTKASATTTKASATTTKASATTTKASSTTAVTSTTTTGKTTIKLPEITVSGDTNNDGKVNMADVVLIMQSLVNPDKYGAYGTDPTHMTWQGIANSDVSATKDGLTNYDALVIQKYLLEIIPSLPEQK